MLTAIVALTLAVPISVEADGVRPFEVDLYCRPGAQHLVVVLPDRRTRDDALALLLEPLKAKYSVAVLADIRGEQELIRMHAFIAGVTAREQSNPMCPGSTITGFGLVGIGNAASLALRQEPEVKANVLIEPEYGYSMGSLFQRPQGALVINSTDACAATSREQAESFIVRQAPGPALRQARLALGHCAAIFAGESCREGCAATGEPAVLVKAVLDYLGETLLNERPARPAMRVDDLRDAEDIREARRPTPDRARKINDQLQINISLLAGFVAGSAGLGGTLAVRPEVFLPFRHVGCGAFVDVGATIGRDVVVAFGPAVVFTGGHDWEHPGGLETTGLTLLPSIYYRDLTGWGAGLGFSVRWMDRYGVGVDTRFGFAAKSERTVRITLQADLFLPLMMGVLKAMFALGGHGGWIM